MKRDQRLKRHYRIRQRVGGSKGRPRLSVFRSSRHIYAQVIDDETGTTLVAMSDLKLDVKTAKTQKSFEMGKRLAGEALKKGITKVIFDRGGFLYHGRVKSLAEGAREGGLKF